MVSRSPHGRFKRVDSVLDRYLSKVDSSGGPDACWPWIGGAFASGYGRLALDDHQRSSVRAHRWGYETLVGPIPPGEVVRHACDTPLCQNPAHWILGTSAMNSRDMVERGRSLRGATNPNARLDENAVKAIRALAERVPAGRGRSRRGDLTYGTIARLYDVTPALVGQIRRGQAWKHLFETSTDNDRT